MYDFLASQSTSVSKLALESRRNLVDESQSLWGDKRVKLRSKIFLTGGHAEKLGG